MTFTPGTRVRLLSTGEIGIVVHGWRNQELDAMDYHIAFYGREFPATEPKAPPYVLRYLETSLEEVNE